MSENNARLKAFEARLASLRKNVEAGLGERAQRIEAHIRDLSHATASAAREGLRHEAHKLRGIAGSVGHVALGELAGALEQIALDAPSELVANTARGLVDAVHRIGGSSAVLAETGGAAAAPSATAAAPSLTQSGVRTRKHVLAIDDDDETRKLLEITLRQLGGYDTTVASSGSEALACLQSGRFDLVLCDAMMPDMNGLTFCARARALGLPIVPPIVILSAATMEELGWTVTSEQAPFDWWRKPFRPKLLAEQVRALLLSQ